MGDIARTLVCAVCTLVFGLSLCCSRKLRRYMFPALFVGSCLLRAAGDALRWFYPEHNNARILRTVSAMNDIATVIGIVAVLALLCVWAAIRFRGEPKIVV